MTTTCEHSYFISVLLLSQPVHHLWYLGHAYTKAIRSWLLSILVFSLVESVTHLGFRLREGRFGLQSITSIMNKNLIWNLIWQVCVMLARIVRNFFMTALEGKLDKRDLGLH